MKSSDCISFRAYILLSVLPRGAGAKPARNQVSVKFRKRGNHEGMLSSFGEVKYRFVFIVVHISFTRGFLVPVRAGAGAGAGAG